MKPTRIRLSPACAAMVGPCLIAATLLIAAMFRAPAQEIAPPPGTSDGSADRSLPAGGEGYEALTRGPLHEAFATPFVSNPRPGVIVDVQPPEPIDEIPPDQMPAGENVVWIPGYWGWAPEEEDFVWISGIWRDVPTDRRWIPGYWSQAEEGWQWVAGFWTSAGTEQLAYQPTPPESLEQGPNTTPPDGDYFWVPGCWIWQQVQYEWRPGYWAPAAPDWVWVPDHYLWTPYGCVFVAGYWDYPFVERGVMFAPVHFAQAVYREPAFQYVPTVVINPAPLLIHLFVSPTYGHYYYGDYYGYQPRRRGFEFTPWYAVHDRPSRYDPLLTYQQWSYGRRGVNIVDRLRRWNRYFVEHDTLRPPHTFGGQRDFLARVDREQIAVQPSTLAFASPLDSYIESRASEVRFQRVSEPDRQRISERRTALQQFQQQRNRFEAAAEAGSSTTPGPGEQPQANRRQSLALPGATILGRADRRSDREGGPAPGRQPEPDATDPTRPPGVQAPDRRPALPPRPNPGNNPRAGEQARDRDLPPGDRPAGDRPNRETPDTERPGLNRPRPDRPGSDRPNADRPNADRPGIGRPGRPGLDNRRPDSDRPGIPGRGEDRPGVEPPGQERPDRDRTGDVIPSRDRGEQQPGRDRQRPSIPRFGNSRVQPPDRGGGPNAGSQPGRQPDAGTRPDRGRNRSRSNPLESGPPGLEGLAPGSRDRTPQAGQPSGRGPRGEDRSLRQSPTPGRGPAGNVPKARNTPGSDARPTPQQPRTERPRPTGPAAQQQPAQSKPQKGNQGKDKGGKK